MIFVQLPLLLGDIQSHNQSVRDGLITILLAAQIGRCIEKVVS